jgi:hypothetical protein
MTSPLAGVAAINAIGFGVYGSTISRFRDKSAISSHFCAGALIVFHEGVLSNFQALCLVCVNL